MLKLAGGVVREPRPLEGNGIEDWSQERQMPPFALALGGMSWNSLSAPDVAALPDCPSRWGVYELVNWS
jgi:hypothetical protein